MMYEVDVTEEYLGIAHNDKVVALIQLKLPVKRHIIRIREDAIEVKITYANPLGDDIYQEYVYSRSWRVTDEPVDLERIFNGKIPT